MLVKYHFNLPPFMQGFNVERKTRQPGVID